MKIYVQPNEVVESYRLTSETALDVFATDSYKKRWVITLNDGTQYLTVKVMSVARARVMRGRATLVWAVVRFIDGQPGKEVHTNCYLVNQAHVLVQIFVLKQSWRPESIKSEGELYSEANGSDCEFLARITLYEDAIIDDMVDRTGAFIRAGLSDSLPPVDKQRPGAKRPRLESEERFLHVASTDDDEIDRITTPRMRAFVSRVHTRVIMSTYGWPLKYFATLKELLVVFLNGVQGMIVSCVRHIFDDNDLQVMNISATTVFYTVISVPGMSSSRGVQIKEQRLLLAPKGVLLTWIAQSWVLDIPERSLRLKLKMTQYQRLKLCPSPPQSLLILEHARTRPSCHYHYSPRLSPLRMMCSELTSTTIRSRPSSIV